MTEHDVGVDTAKGIGIILIVFGHNWIIAHDHGEIFRIVFSFHVPLFFFLSGVFLRPQQDFAELLRSRADALLKPFFVVLLAWGLARFLVSHIDLRSYLLGMLYGTGNTIEWVPLWFLPHLFLAMLLVWAMLRIGMHSARAERITVINMVLLLAAGISVIHLFASMDASQFNGLNQLLGNRQGNFPGLPWSLDLIGVSSAFILLGQVLRQQVVQFKPKGYLSALALAVFVALHYLFDETMDLNMRLYGSWWISTLQALLGIYLVLAISVYLQRYSGVVKVLAYFGSSSLFIMIFHSWIEVKAFTMAARWISNDYLNAMLAMLAGLLLPLLLLEMTKRLKFLSMLLLPIQRQARKG